MPNRRFIMLFLVLALSTLAGIRWKDRFSSPQLRVLFFDVGQGDSALVLFPGGKSLLIDAGGGFGEWDLGRKELLPELARLGVLTLDYALLSHPDQDHGYGFTTLVEELRIGELWFSADLLKQTPVKPLFEDLRQRAKKRGIPLHPVSTLERKIVGGVEWQSWPSRGRARNDWAVLSRFSFAGCEILFTADIEAAGEERLIKERRGPVTLLKVAHHGSRTSSTSSFLKWARARWAVVSTGHRNRYGHPHPSVLRRLKAAGAEVLRTDFHGFVEFTISPQGEVICRTAEGSCGTSFCTKPPKSSGPSGAS